MHSAYLFQLLPLLRCQLRNGAADEPVGCAHIDVQGPLGILQVQLVGSLVHLAEVQTHTLLHSQHTIVFICRAVLAEGKRSVYGETGGAQTASDARLSLAAHA